MLHLLRRKDDCRVANRLVGSGSDQLFDFIEKRINYFALEGIRFATCAKQDFSDPLGMDLSLLEVIAENLVELGVCGDLNHNWRFDRDHYLRQREAGAIL